MADFNFYLNRVGVRGPKGEQGEQGFSPIITVATDTLSEYILQIQTQNNTFLTANLREHKDDLGGTYIRYNRETGVMYAGEADTATTQNLGEVRFATATELERNDGSTVVTPANVNTLIDARDYDGAIEAVDDKADANADNITTLQGRVNGILGNYVTTDTNQTISGTKTFNNLIALNKQTYVPAGLYVNANNTSYTLLSLGDISSGLVTNIGSYNIETRVNGSNVLFTNTPSVRRNDIDYTIVDSGNILNYVGNGTITFTQGGVTKGTITTNQSGNTTIALDAGGGVSYTEGPGININNDEISVDDTVVALKSDLPNMNNYYNTTQVDLMLQDKADISAVPTKTSDLTNDSGFITSASLPDVSNMVKTDTIQTITGQKTFNRSIIIKPANDNTLNTTSTDLLLTRGVARFNFGGEEYNSYFTETILEYENLSGNYDHGNLNFGTLQHSIANGEPTYMAGNINLIAPKGLYRQYDDTTKSLILDTSNIGNYALTSSNISTNAYIQALEARIAALEANINGGNAASA